MIPKALFCCGIVLLSGGLAFCDQFPYTGSISADRVNIRSGPNINFEKLIKLNKGDEVVVLNRSFSWYKIKLPVQSPCYISAQFIKVHTPQLATVSGKKVLLRCGPGEKFNVLGKLARGTPIRIFEKVDGWYRIEPPEGSYGWVSDQYVSYKLARVPKPRFPKMAIRDLYRRKWKAQQKIVLKNRTVELKGEMGLDGSVRVDGHLVDLGRVVRSKQLRYKLIVDGKIAYYLEGDRRTFNRLINQRVRIQGTLKEYPDQHYNYPVLAVNEIHPLESQEGL